MKSGETRSWSQQCLLQAQLFTMFIDATMAILIAFIITSIAGRPALYWRTGASTPALTIIEHCWLILLCVLYILFTACIMFLQPEVRTSKWSFFHGFVVGYGFPFGFHLIGEASSWFEGPSSPALAGLSVLSGFLGGLSLCASFIYWMILSPPVFLKIINNRCWVKQERHVTDASMVSLLSILVLTCSALMLWSITAVQPQQAFAMIINTAAYLSVLTYLYLVKVNYFTSFMALGALAGAFSAIALIAAKFTFNFASRWNVADAALKADLFMVTLVFQAALALYVIPFLFIWKNKEAEVQTIKESSMLARGGGEGRGYAEELPG